MAVRLLISLLMTLSIVASGLLLANAQKATPASALAKTAATQAKTPDNAKATLGKPGDAAAQKPDGQTSQAVESQKAEAKKPLPVLMELSTSKDTFNAYEDMMVKAEIWAVQPVTVCLYSEHPEANFSADVFRAGYGKLDNVPNVVQLTPQDLRNVDRVKLEPGQMHRIVFNIKKLVPLPASFWKTGEYRVDVKFYLCGRTEGSEVAVPSQTPLRLLVLE